MCSPDELLIGFDDFSCVADLVDTCTIDRLCPYIREAQEIHLSSKVGWGLLEELIENKDNEEYKDLLCGSTFEYCGKTQKHFGIKRVLVYYSNGLYKYSNNYVDMPYGTVYKQVADSVPVDEKILTRMRNENFNLANEYWQGVEKYLCANKETYTKFDTCNCSCECGECENKTGTGKARLRKIKTFKKYGNNYNNKQGCESIHQECRCDNC